jgi:chromosome segregation ATPase
MEDASKDIL